MDFEHLLKYAVDSAKAPGAVLCIGDLQRTRFLGAYGNRQLLPEPQPATTDTLYDLASLTKVVCTTTAIMQLRDQKLLDLDQSVTDFIPIPAFRDMTLRHLFTHTAGLVPVLWYYKTMTTFEEMMAHYAEDGIEHPVDFQHNYSDVGFMLLGKVVEVISGQTLDTYFHQYIAKPLEMNDTHFNPPVEKKGRCAPTEDDRNFRNQIVHGSVHDENGHALGGVSGHAGLFSTAADLTRFCRGLLEGLLLSKQTLQEMTAIGIKPLYPWQGLGWQIDPWHSKSNGFLPSRTAFGHTGWTGTSLWLDRETGLFTILLSNTCHPSRTDRDNVLFRRELHIPIARELYTTTNAHSGLDRLIRENFSTITGKRIALLTNHAAIDQTGRHILDALADCPDLRLTRLFSPEHGIRGQAEAGEKVEGQTSPVPVTSLYGSQKAPAPEELKGIELFVVDLQDIGARYYTYMATMKNCIEACAKAKVPLLILDRPNPLGGIILEGPIAQETESLVSCSSIPIRHGMTMGELALWFAQRDLRSLRPDISVNLLDGWPPRFWFPECALPWRAPSPNMPSPETALMYIGTCLIEGTNMNEGRGTETPFLIIGAPWLEAQRVIDALNPEDIPGLKLSAETYTPKSIPSKATNPKFQDVPCQGIRFTIQDPYAARPFHTTIALIIAIRALHPNQFEFTKMFRLLAGGPKLQNRIETGATAQRINEETAAELANFEPRRPRLYDPDGIPTSYRRPGR